MDIIKVIEPSLDYGGELSAHLPPRLATTFDMRVFNMCETLTTGYKGGSWEMVIVKDDEERESFYLKLRSNKRFKIIVNSNYFKAEVSADTLSLISTLFVFNALSWSLQNDPEKGELMAKLYHRLFSASLDTPEAASIIGALD